MSLQQLAMGDIEDEDDDDDDIEEWKPKDGKIKRKKQQKMTNAKRQHVDMVEEFEPRKAKKVAELEISKSEPDGSDDDEGDDDYSPVNGAAEDAEEDVEDEEEEEDSDDFIGWELEDDEDSDEDEDEGSDEDVDALYDEEDSDYDEDIKDLETALKSLRSKSDTETQLKTRSTEKKKRVLRARETTPPKIKTSPRKSASKTPDAGNKENIDRPIKQLGSSPAKQSKEIKTPAALKKTPAGKTLGTPKEGTKTQAGKVTSKPETPAVGSPGGDAEARQSPRGKTPVRKPELKTPSGKTPASAAAVVDTPGKTPAAKGKAGSTPGKAEGKTPKGKGNETKTPNTQKGKGDAVKTPAAKSAKKESGAKKQLVKTPLKVKLRSGTTLEDIVIGDGKLAKSGKMVFVYYKGLLNNGEEFDSCLKGKPFLFRLGSSEVIKGWEEGIAGMKVGGKRKLTIPPSQGYGNRRAGKIPPSSTLTFEVQLMNVK